MNQEHYEEILRRVQQELDSNNQRTSALLQARMHEQHNDLRVSFNSIFDGDRSKSIHFIDDLNMFFSLHPGASDAKKLYIAQSSMRGDAKDWFHTEVKLRGWTSWQDFQIDFLMFFTDHVSQQRADEELRCLKQSANGDCGRHVQKFQNIVERSTLDRKNSKMMISFFINSLNDKWRREIQRQAMLVPSLLESFPSLVKTLLQLEGIDTNFKKTSQADLDSWTQSPMEVDSVLVSAVAHSGVVPDKSGTQMSLADFQELKSWCIKKGVCHFCLRHVRTGTALAHEPSQCSYRDAVKEMRMDKPNKAVDKLYISSFNSRAQVPIHFESSKLSWHALVDSGAQGTLYISQKLANHLGIRSSPLKRKLALYDFSDILVAEVTHATASIPFRLQDRAFKGTFYIISSCSSDVIVGLDWMAQNGAIFDSAARKLLYPSATLWAALRSEERNASHLSPNASSNCTLYSPKISVSQISRDQVSDTLPIPQTHQLIIANTMTPADIARIPDFLRKFRDVFDKSKTNFLPPSRVDFDLKLELENSSILRRKSPIYRLTLEEEKLLKDELDAGLKSGKIASCNASYASPAFFNTRHGKMRLCVDYRQLNAACKSYQASIPRMDDILAQAAGCSLYSKIDLKGAFNLLRMHPESEELTAFQTKFGTFKYRVVPFGLRNGPTVFQRFIVHIFADLPQVFVFIDDFLIVEPDPELHMKLLQTVFQRLLDNHLIVSLDKCEFMVSKVHFLGHVLHAGGISMETDKLQAINAFPSPQTKKQLQSFLGMTNYYRQFIPRYSLLTTPLTNLLKKGTDFNFDEICLHSFQHLKASFSSEAFLVAPDRSKQFILETDASSFAMGAVLHQQHDSFPRPIGFYSAKWDSAQLNYAIPDKELLAILLALRHWRHLLHGTTHPVLIKCDHQNLSRFRSHSRLTARQMRWYMELDEYNFQIDYSPGSTLQVADALSRRPDHYADAHTSEGACILPASRVHNSASLTIAAARGKPIISRALPAPPDIADVSSSPTSVDEAASFSSPMNDADASVEAETDTNSFESARPDTILDWDLLCFTDLRVSTPPLMAESAALADPSTTSTTSWPIHVYNKLAHGKDYPSSLPRHIKKLIDRWYKDFKVEHAILYKKIRFNGRLLSVPYLPVRHRDFYMRQTHECFGHFKSSASIDSLRIRYWWPRMASDYKDYVKSCTDCALVDGKRQGKPTLLPLQDPGVPFHSWHLDFLQDLPETSNSNTQILVAVDRSTRLVKALACKSRSTDTVLRFVEDLIHSYGCPSVLIHDRALCFLSAEFRSYCAKQNIQTLPSSSYHPQTNGMVERINQEIKRMLVKLCQNDLHLWDRFLAPVVLNLNVRKHVITGYSPFSLCYGFEPKLPMDATPIRMWNFSNEQDRHAFMTRELDLLGCHRAAAFHRSQRQARLLTENSKNLDYPIFQVGEYVQRKIKRLADQVTPSFGFKWAGPFVVDRITLNGSYYLKKLNGVVESHPTSASDLAPYAPSRGGVMSWRHQEQKA
jgi:hypothetical protein